MFFQNFKLHTTSFVFVLTGATADDCDELELESDLTFFNGSNNNQSWSALTPPPHGFCHVFGGSGQPYRTDQGGVHTNHLQGNLHGGQMSQQL